MKRTLRVVAPIFPLLVLLNMIPAGMAQKRAPRTQTGASRKARGDASGPVFGVAQTYAAGFGGPSQSVSADLNGDGIPDLAVVNPCDSSYCGSGYASVAILIGNGDGSFQAPVVYATGTFEPMSLAVGDFNGDGAPDLAVAQCGSSVNCGTGQVSVLLGNGDGTFQSPVPYSTGNGSSYFVATADFNGDGILDLAVANQTGGNSEIAILLGNGDGTFQAPVGYSTGAASAAYISVGDFNLDGAADLAVANTGTQDSVSILLGNGDGSFQTAVVYSSGGAFAKAVAVGDFNGDGAPDLAVVNGCATYYNLDCSQSGSVGVLLGNGDGTFQAPVAYGSGGNEPNSLAIADFDGDGNLDLAVANLGPSAGNSSAGVLGLLLGNGDGTFQPAATFGAGGNFAVFVSAADFNGDGQPDVAVVGQCDTSGTCATGVVGVLLNTASGFSLYASSTAMTSSVNPAASGQSVLLTATVTPGFNNGAPTGSVTFYDGATALSTVAVSSGQAAYTASFASPGPQALQAVYSGDSNYAASASAVLSEIVGTPVTLSSSLNPSAFNQSVTITASVAGGGGTPTGNVTFMDGATLLGKLKLVNGSAAISGSALTVGDHSITATYNGDTTFAPGAAVLTQSVSQSSAAALVSSANPASTNQPVTFTATVTGQYGGVPTGTVAFMQGSPFITWGTAPLVNGQATITDTFSKAANYPVAAVYLGSDDYQSSASPTISQVVSGNQSVNTTTALATSGTPSFINQPVTFTATLNPASGTIPNGETVTFYNGTNTLGTAATAAGQAAFTTSSLPAGSNSITATYAGDGTYQSSTSKVVNQVVKLTPTNTTLTSSLNPSTYGQAVTFSVAVTPQSGSGTPTGTVILKNGSAALGSVTLSNGAGTYTTSTLAAGSLSISASYGGDANFASSSAALSQTVNVATTTTTLTSTPNPSSLNQTVTFTATVASQYGGKPTGNVTFKEGTTVLGNAALALERASLNYAFSTTGTFQVVATYTGDASDSGSVSNTLPQTVGGISTTTTLTSSGSPAYAGQTITFTATVTPSSGAIPNGETVTFYDGAVSMGTGATQGGTATLATSALAVGTHSITATYAGDATYTTSTSKILRQTVSLGPSATTLASNANPASYGQPVTLTATVAAEYGSQMPTGKVIFKNGASVIGSVTLINGSAAITKTNLATGSLSLTASYEGDANFASSSATLLQVVAPAATTTTLSSSPNPSSLGQAVTFTANVASQYQGAVTGSVSFLNGSKTLGSGTFAKGAFTFTYAFSTAGTDSITAVYSGDANNLTSTSQAVSQMVTSAPTTTTVTSSNSNANVGQPVTFTATVTSTYGAIPNGELVTFYDSATSIGTGNTQGGAAAMTTSSLAAGVHQITATYAGDASFNSSNSKILKQTITAAATTTVLTSSANPSAYGQPVAFTATVSDVTSGGPTPTGTVTFKNGTAALGTATLNSQGVATATTLTLAAGTYSITAVYSGDASSAKSTSAALSQTVNQATTTTQIFSSVNPAALGETVVFTAVVRSLTTFATGSVTFTAGSTSLGTANLINGSAKLPVATLPAGATTVTASYASSANVAGSSGSIVQYVD
jgi:Big-like domain-containing protein/VCBS repeat protein